MKHKVKRYQEGGEAELKKRGLEESKNERSGFLGLGRLLEGNIDKPGSVAYEKYGAGRGRAAKAKEETSVAEDRPMAKSSFGYEDMGSSMPLTSPFAIQGEGIKDIDRSPAEAPKTEAMKKTNIGGYAQSATGEEGSGSGVRSTTGQEKKKVVKKAAAKKTSQEFPIRDRDRADQSFPLKTDDKKVPPLRKIGEAIMGTMERKSMPYSSSLYDKMKGRKAGGSVKMASGGKVSSASSRGDGIAQRGKTRGRIC